MNLFNWLRRDPPTPDTDDELPAVVPEPSDSEALATDEGDPAAEPAEPALLRLDAVALWTAFRENQVAAEARYIGRPLELAGEVDRVDRDHRGRIRVHFKVNTFNTLQALYPEVARAQVARLKPGDKVRFHARVDNLDTGYVVVAAESAGA